jgi:hypothetical protein
MGETLQAKGDLAGAASAFAVFVRLGQNNPDLKDKIDNAQKILSQLEMPDR